MAKEIKEDDAKIIEKLNTATRGIRNELAKRIIGQEKVIDQLLIAMLSKGHALIVGVPGLAKTMMISTLSEILDLSFSRIQFTPDLMPSDITGTEIIEEDRSTGKRVFKFVKGPVFANIILADEINRTPPKTQAALLQAMQEKEITSGEHYFKLEEPFFVLATQNPIEQEGTYPLPEAQLDRFMFKIYIDYPSPAEELDIVKYTTSAYDETPQTILSREQILELQGLVRRVPAPDYVIQYAVSLVSATRPNYSDKTYIKEWVQWGAGPRASQFLIIGAKTRAILEGRVAPSVEDVRQLAQPVLRHRIITSFHAQAEGISSDDIVSKLLEDIRE